jgi:methyl-accepting chemotaxis protein
VKVSEEARKALSEIVTQAVKVSDIVVGIAAASQEQSKGIGEVNLAVSQMDKVTQRNSSNAEELSASSEELAGQAGSIREMVTKLVVVLEGGKSRSGSHDQRSSGPIRQDFPAPAKKDAKRTEDFNPTAARKAVYSPKPLVPLGN